MISVVLDASAVLALLNSEPGADLVAASLGGAVISAVNHAEVVSKLVERGGTRPVVQLALAAIDVRVVEFDVGLAERVGYLRGQTRHLGLSLADRACLALAERERVPALTGDRAWIGAIPTVEVRAIR